MKTFITFIWGVGLHSETYIKVFFIVMETKICSKCKEQKDKNLFIKDKSKKDGLRSECLICTKTKRDLNRDERIRKRKAYLSIESNKIKHKQQCRDSYYRNRELRLIKSKEQESKHKEKRKAQRRLYYLKNKERLNEKSKKWRKNNIERHRELHRKNQLIKRKNNILIKLAHNLRSIVYQSFKSKKWNKNNTTEFLLGEKYNIVKEHIERQFKKGMTWENHGEWHIDHIIPISSAKTEEELIQLFHYTNIQPLWAKENLTKHNKILATQMSLTI